MSILPHASRFKNDNRGQLLLLAAVAVVVIVLGTITLVNTAGFTEREQAIGVADDSTVTLEVLSETEKAIESSIRHANHDRDSTGTPDREQQLTDDIAELESQLNEQFNAKTSQVRFGIPDPGTDDYNEGVRFWQYPHNSLITAPDVGGPQQCNDPPFPEPPCDVTEGGSPGLFENADSVRSFNMEVTGNNLADEGDGDPFTVQLGADNDDVTIVNDVSTDEDIIISDQSGNECTVSATEEEPAMISFVDGTVNTETCDALPATEAIEDVGFDNGDNIETTLDLVADVEDGDVAYIDDAEEQDSIQDSPDSSELELEAHYAVYDVEVPITVTTENGEITTTIRVAPNLPQHAVDRGA